MPRADRDATSFGYVAGAGYKLFPRSLVMAEFEHNMNRIVGQRFRVMDSKILIGQFSALGASAIVLPFGELYTALQTGVIDAQENPLDIIQAMKFFEVQKNLLVTDHGAIVECILFSPKFMQRLSDSQI